MLEDMRKQGIPTSSFDVKFARLAMFMKFAAIFTPTKKLRHTIRTVPVRNLLLRHADEVGKRLPTGQAGPLGGSCRHKPNPKRIFAFWEPKDKIPSYLKLCVKTWEKNMPGYEIAQIDYSNLDEWLGEGFFDPVLYRDFGLNHQSDALRCALLRLYGGLWLDMDTIIASKDNMALSLEISQDFEFNSFCPALIYAPRPNATILRLYEEKIRYVIDIRKNGTLPKISWGALGGTNYLPFAKYLRDKYFRFGFEGMLFSNKLEYMRHLGVKWRNDRDEFIGGYLEMKLPADYVLARSPGGYIILNNAFVPSNIRDMDEKQFLATGCTLANVLKKVLGL